MYAACRAGSGPALDLLPWPREAWGVAHRVVGEITDTQLMIRLGAALAIGLLIGVERGWKLRGAREGQRIAGLRTFGLMGLFGGVAGLLGQYLSAAVLGWLFVGFALAVAGAYILVQLRQGSDVSITSLVVALLTFALGALAAQGQLTAAASAAVVTALILQMKQLLHGWLERIERYELHAAFQLLLISVVLLPVLPDRGYGPWGVLNPYEIWWMVVLIAGISFIGYFFMKLAGPGRGVVLTALSAGMVSSTALTLQFARLARRRSGSEALLGAGILIACGVMFPRMLVVAGLINPGLLRWLLVPMGAMTLVSFVGAWLLWRVAMDRSTQAPAPMHNPLELQSALLFGALLALVVLVSKMLKEWMGETGIYLLAAVSGIADVDALNLSLSRMSLTDLALSAAVLGILIAGISNTLFKASLAAFIGGAGLGVKVFPPLILAAASGMLATWLMS